jgi:Mg2+-importing ATPase
MTSSTLQSPKATASAEGLTSSEAAERLARFGLNDPAPVRQHSALRQFLHLFLNPLVLILLIAAGISGFTGQGVDAAIIVVVLLLGVCLDFFQTFRSQHAIERLRDRVAPTARVRRDREWREIPRREVVPGDLLQLSAGDLIPADARLLESRDLFVQQAALTGESLPAEKETTADPVSADPQARNMVFLGSSVVSGTATAEVAATGLRTAFGSIAARLSGRPEETAFDRGLHGFSMLIARVVLFLILFLIVVSVALHRDPLQSLLFAIALAVGLTPEFLPMITSVTLSKGAIAMARKKVIVKHLSAIQNFGSIDVLCSDKTGTLTAGSIVLDRALDPFGTVSARVHLLGYLNSIFETGIRSPLDKAICAQCPPEADGYEKRDEIPFDFERRRASVVVERGGERTLITKGAPEGILALTTEYESGGQILPMDAEMRARALQCEEDLSRQGFRVLAVAYSKVADQPAYSTKDEHDLVLAGFLSFNDPPLADAADALAALRRDGVEVKIITGDNDLVTRHISAQVGLDASDLVTGAELERLTDPALAQVADRSTVFARVAPAGKSRILLALKRRGHVVGFMGDGINDAPSLRAADVGVSVSTAADVARDAADIILLEPGLRVLHEGIVEGRKAFGNVMKYLLMGTSSNFGNMLSMAGASLFLPFLPMLPTQILLNNFLYDLAQVSIPTDHVDESFLRKPQHWDIALIRKFMLLIGPISSVFDFLTFYVLLHFFHAGEAEFHTGWFVESLATQTLVLFVIRTAGNPLRSRPSAPLAVTTVAVVLAGIAIPFTSLGATLGFVPLPGAYFAFLALATAVYLGMVELAKRRVMPSYESAS